MILLRAVKLVAFRRRLWEERRIYAMRRIAWAVVAVATVLVFALPAFAQEVQQDTCDWYWDYNYVKSGGWEYWCWNPTLGWWYSTDGKSKVTTVTIQS
jgi:hypothetical protein